MFLVWLQGHFRTTLRALNPACSGTSLHHLCFTSFIFLHLSLLLLPVYVVPDKERVPCFDDEFIVIIMMAADQNPHGNPRWAWNPHGNQDASVDVAVFCLALMGTDYASFLREAFRVLKPWRKAVGGRGPQPIRLRGTKLPSMQQSAVAAAAALPVRMDAHPRFTCWVPSNALYSI